MFETKYKKREENSELNILLNKFVDIVVALSKSNIIIIEKLMHFIM